MESSLDTPMLYGILNVSHDTKGVQVWKYGKILKDLKVLIR